MSYATPQYSKKAVTRAGVTLITPLSDEASLNAYFDALDIINNWRSSHIYPLQAIKNTLANRAKKIDKTVISAQRLKRLSSIQTKLSLLGNSQLGGMQDIGGCRAILKTVEQVNKLVDVYDLADIKNPLGRPKLIDSDDYILNPKASGYRSVHLVIKYESFAQTCQAWNGLKIEIQIRSRLQHYWATAVETASTILGEPLKSGKGNKKWIRFFALAGSAFAAIEKSELVPNTPTDWNELCGEIKALWFELQISNFLEGCVITTDLSKKNLKTYERFLLRLDSKEQRISVKGYAQNDILKATQEYLLAEKETADKFEIQVVLVSVDSLSKLRIAYPNYYADTTGFLNAIKAIIID